MANVLVKSTSAAVVLALALLGCSATPPPKLVSSTSNYEACLASVTASKLAASRQGSQLVSISVGSITDKSGKLSQAEGAKITQGASDMASTYIGKLASANVIRSVEREEVKVFERELALIDKKLLKTTGVFTPTVSITGADYYIVGGISELNYNAASSGGRVKSNGVSVSNKAVAASVAIDLRLIKTSTLEVYSVSTSRATVFLNESEGAIIDGSSVLILGNSAQSELNRTVRKLIVKSISELLTKSNFDQVC